MTALTEEGRRLKKHPDLRRCLLYQTAAAAERPMRVAACHSFTPPLPSPSTPYLRSLFHPHPPLPPPPPRLSLLSVARLQFPIWGADVIALPVYSATPPPPPSVPPPLPSLTPARWRLTQVEGRMRQRSSARRLPLPPHTALRARVPSIAMATVGAVDGEGRLE